MTNDQNDAQQKVIDAYIKTAAESAGIIDSDLSKLIPRDGVSVDANFNVSGVESAVNSYKERKPNLFALAANTPEKPEFEESAADYFAKLTVGSPEWVQAKEMFVKHGDPRRSGQTSSPIFTKNEKGERVTLDGKTIASPPLTQHSINPHPVGSFEWIARHNEFARTGR